MRIKNKATADKNNIESDQLFKTLWDKSNDGMRLTDDKGMIIKVNHAYCSIVGKKARDMEGECLDVVYTEEEGRNILSSYQETYINKKGYNYFEKKFSLWNNKKVWLGVSVSFLNLPDGSQAVLSVFHDITNRKQKEEQLLLQSLVLDQIYDNVTVVDLKGIIRFVNKAECEMMNCSAADLVGKHVSIYGDEPVKGKKESSIFDYVLKYGEWRGEVFKYSKTGKKIFLDNRVSLVYDNLGKPIGMCGVSTDITLKKEAEEALRQNEKKLRDQNERLEILNRKLNKSNLKIKEINEELSKAREKAEESDQLKSDFIANMSHEIRTPMNGILGFTDLLKTTSIKPEKKDLFIQIIEQSGQRMLGILNNIIDISKIEAGLVEVSRENTKLNSLLKELYDFFKPEAESNGLRFEMHKGLPDNNCCFSTDRQKLQQIISNLIKNAIKFTDKGRIDFGYKKVGSSLEFFVSDSGCGINVDDKEKVFKRFWRAKGGDRKRVEGTGLGLPITKSLTELLGGKIWFESEPGKGSVFYISFPMPEDSSRASGKTVEQAPISNKRRDDLKILIAEDDFFSAEYLKTILEPLTTGFIIAENGLKAVELCQQNDDIDIILMDIKMPELDGLEATRRIRKFKPDIPIIAQTAFALEGDRDLAINSGCNEYITKPVKAGELLKIIDKLLTS